MKITKYKDLFFQLTLREIKAKYKQSILGYAWVIVVPLVNLIVLSIVFSYLFRVPTGNIPYTIYLFVALVPWTFMANAIVAATGSVSGNSSLITKIYFPREIFPLAAISAKFIDLILTSIVLLLFLIFFGIKPYMTDFYIPLILFAQLLVLTGISFVLSSANAFFRDVENILPVGITVWMYMTPIIYSPELIPKNLKFLFSLNPMIGIIDGYRNSILYGVSPAWPSFIYSLTFGVVIFIIGYYFFRRSSRFFADVI